MKELLKEWLIDTGIRTVKTMAETAFGIITTAAFMGEVNWTAVFSASLLSGIACVLVNVKRLPGGGEYEDDEQK